jgi:hypothetical protein
VPNEITEQTIDELMAEVKHLREALREIAKPDCYDAERLHQIAKQALKG